MLAQSLHAVQQVLGGSAVIIRNRITRMRETASAPALIAVALGLGLREGALLGLSWAGSINDPGIDLEHGEVRVYQQLQFGRLVQLKRSWHRRVLPLLPWLVAVLERMRRCWPSSASSRARSGASTGSSLPARWARRARPATCG